MNVGRFSSSLPPSRHDPSFFQPPFPSSSSRRCTYDVFLSFRGEDTRNTFTDHLYAALTRAGVWTFRDAEGLRRGEKIGELLVETIQRCRISLIVFSQNYVDSRWCLEELVQIMECRRTQRQLVFPIFYHVDPSHVRKQQGSFGKAFEKHEAELLTEGKDKIAWWRAALYGAASLAGFDIADKSAGLKADLELLNEGRDQIARWRAALGEAASLAGFDIADRPEAEFINSIVDEICRQLSNTYLDLAVYPVGIDSRVEDVRNSLCVGLGDDVRMVGIWGMGGIGKTTLAKAIYNKFYHHFESESFLADVRETAMDSNGKISLQERLLADVLKPTKIVEGDVSRGINVIRERLGRKKVLVVDDVEQLSALAIRRESFGTGSRIIITTRDRHVLELEKVETIHPILEMNEEEALELFSRHAFHNHSPDEDFSKISKRVVKYCGGLPLALEVLGSFLFYRSVREWASTLNKLGRNPDGKIQSRLRISYDAIDESQRNIFLHISCFFIGMNKPCY